MVNSRKYSSVGHTSVGYHAVGHHAAFAWRPPPDTPPPPRFCFLHTHYKTIFWQLTHKSPLKEGLGLLYHTGQADWYRVCLNSSLSKQRSFHARFAPLITHYDIFETNTDITTKLCSNRN